MDLPVDREVDLRSVAIVHIHLNSTQHQNGQIPNITINSVNDTSKDLCRTMDGNKQAVHTSIYLKSVSPFHSSSHSIMIIDK